MRTEMAILVLQPGMEVRQLNYMYIHTHTKCLQLDVDTEHLLHHCSFLFICKLLIAKF